MTPHNRNRTYGCTLILFAIGLLTIYAALTTIAWLFEGPPALTENGHPNSTLGILTGGALIAGTTALISGCIGIYHFTTTH